MFEEVHARFDEYFEGRHPSTTPESADRVFAAIRLENRAAAAQLAAIGELPRVDPPTPQTSDHPVVSTTSHQQNSW